MTNFSSSDDENEMIIELMVEGFEYPLPHRQECLEMLTSLVIVVSQVTVAVPPQGDASDEVPEGVPFQVEAPKASTSDFALWRCQLNNYATSLCADTFMKDRDIYRVFTTPLPR